MVSLIKFYISDTPAGRKLQNAPSYDPDEVAFRNQVAEEALRQEQEAEIFNRPEKEEPQLAASESQGNQGTATQQLPPRMSPDEAAMAALRPSPEVGTGQSFSLVRSDEDPENLDGSDADGRERKLEATTPPAATKPKTPMRTAPPLTRNTQRSNTPPRTAGAASARKGSDAVNGGRASGLIPEAEAKSTSQPTQKKEKVEASRAAKSSALKDQERPSSKATSASTTFDEGESRSGAPEKTEAEPQTKSSNAAKPKKDASEPAKKKTGETLQEKRAKLRELQASGKQKKSKPIKAKEVTEVSSTAVAERSQETKTDKSTTDATPAAQSRSVFTQKQKKLRELQQRERKRAEAKTKGEDK